MKWKSKISILFFVGFSFLRPLPVSSMGGSLLDQALVQIANTRSYILSLQKQIEVLQNQLEIDKQLSMDYVQSTLDLQLQIESLQSQLKQEQELLARQEKLYKEQMTAYQSLNISYLFYKKMNKVLLPVVIIETITILSIIGFNLIN